LSEYGILPSGGMRDLLREYVTTGDACAGADTASV
jgi:hypothetical protein